MRFLARLATCTGTFSGTANHKMFYPFAALRKTGYTLIADPIYIVFEGDSLTANDTYPLRAVAGLGADYRRINVAAGGETWTQMQTARAAQCDPYIAANHCTILSIWAGINDMVHVPNSPTLTTTVLGRLQSYVTAAKTAGWPLVVVYTLTPCGDALVDAQYETERLSYNTQLRAGYAGWGADGLVDPGGDATIGDVANVGNTTWFTDGLHLTTAGQNIVGDLATAVLEGLV